MALPAIEAERWRLVEQKLAEFSVDIQRLWRQVQQTQVGGPAHDQVREECSLTISMHLLSSAWFKTSFETALHLLSSKLPP